MNQTRQSLGPRLNLPPILGLLSASRRLVAIGAAVGLLAGLLVVYSVSLNPPGLHARGDSFGVASAQVFVDSKSSQSVDLGEEPVQIDIPGLIARARVLANLIATSPLRDQVARRAGIAGDTFLATAPSVGFDSPKPSATGRRLNVMTVTFNEALPIVTINTEAADEKTAARIAGAASGELRDYLSSLTAQDKVADVHQLVVKQLGRADSATVHRGPHRLTALFAFAFVLGLWCSTIVAVTRLRRLRAGPGHGIAAPARQPPEPIAPALVPAAARARDALSHPPPLSALPERPERPERPRRGVNA